LPSKPAHPRFFPASWEDRARKASEYYIEELPVKNCVNSWSTFTVGDGIKIAGDDEKVKWEAADWTRSASTFRAICGRSGSGASLITFRCTTRSAI
jgi:hypothetical protein